MKHSHAHDRESDALNVALPSCAMNATGNNGPDPADTATDDEIRELATRIRVARRRAGLRQQDVADATGVGLRTISRMERGIRTDVMNRQTVDNYFSTQTFGGEPDSGAENPDLVGIPSIALLAELARRLGVAEHRKGAAWPGPSARVRWKTADGPTETGPTDQPQRLRDHPEEA